MRYLAFAPLAYALDIMRPLQQEALQRGDEFCWLAYGNVLPSLQPHERSLDINQAMAYAPDAVLSPVDWVPYWLPGIKVMVFHGFDTNKRNNDVHFRIRGWYDLFLTQGPSTTGRFQQLAAQHGYFDAQETGWAKLDPLFDPQVAAHSVPATKDVVLYASTFSPAVCSIPQLKDEIERLIREKPWHWLLTTHPKTAASSARMLQELARQYDNAEYVQPTGLMPALKAADMIVCDTSSIIFEMLIQHKPAVTYRNHMPGPHLLNIQHAEELGAAIDHALTQPAELMQAVQNYSNQLHPYRDGRSSARSLDAIEAHIQNFQPRTNKPANYWRKWKLRQRLKKLSHDS